MHLSNINKIYYMAEKILIFFYFVIFNLVQKIIAILKVINFMIIRNQKFISFFFNFYLVYFV